MYYVRTDVMVHKKRIEVSLYECTYICHVIMAKKVTTVCYGTKAVEEPLCIVSSKNSNRSSCNNMGMHLFRYTYVRMTFCEFSTCEHYQQ